MDSYRHARNEETRGTDAPAERNPGAWRGLLGAGAAILAPGIAFSFLAADHLQDPIHEQARLDFEHRVAVVTRNISGAVQRYTDFLHGYRAFFNGSKEIGRDEFAAYMRTLQRSKRYPGLQALSFARAVTAKEQTQFVRQVRQSLAAYAPDLSDYRVHPQGAHSQSFAIEFTEPLSDNAPSLGLDLATERHRLTSVKRARDTGLPTATGMIKLLQDPDQKPAVAWRLAVYRGAGPPATVEQRRERFYGVINAVVIVEDLLEDVLPPSLADRLTLRVFDKGSGEATLIYDNRFEPDAAEELPGTALASSVDLDIGGRDWQLDFQPSPTAALELAGLLPKVVLSAGLLTTALLFLLVHSLATRSLRAMAIARDMNAELLESKERIQAMTDTVPVAIMLLDPKDQRVISLNERAREWLELDNDDSTNHCLSDYLLVNSRLTALLNDVLKRDSRHSAELYLETALGKKMWAHASASATSLRRRRVTLLSLQDITQRKQAEKRIRHLAHYDPLTGLANRNLMNERIDYLIAQARREQSRMGILLLDLDRFKDVNDTLGHGAGDDLLALIAKRLRGAMRETDVVARMGGDEFVIVIPGFSRVRDLAVLAKKAAEVSCKPCMVSGHELHPSASIGVAVYPDDGENREVLLGNADAALYYAKSTSRGHFQFFTSEMNQAVQDRVTLERELRNAFQRRELRLHYQPQVDARGQRVMGLEALLRWERHDGTFVPPDQFIPIAEESGLIDKIGEWVIEEACRHGSIWHKRGYTDLRIAVNISPKQFALGDCYDTVCRVLRKTGFSPSSLELEITEGILIDRQDAVIATLTALHNLGVNVAIDDFGTGYSSLGYLNRLPIDRIKIDRSFMRDLETSQGTQGIVRALIAMADNLGIGLTAEGVETTEQVEFLRARGVSEFQGYHFARPMPAERVDGYLEGRIGESPQVISIRRARDRN